MRKSTKNEAVWQDPIVAEVRATREALFAEAGHDIREFFRRARSRQRTSALPLVTRHRRTAAGVDPPTPA